MEHVIRRQTYFTWKSKYGNASVKDLTRFKQLVQTLRLAHAHVREALRLEVDRGIADSQLPEHIAERGAAFRLSQSKRDLLL